MNEEEKQAIYWLKEELDDEKKSHKNCNYSYKGVTGLYGNNEVEIALKLIEKQQKEIEEYRKLRADIIKVNKKIYDVDIIEDMCEQLANSISKDKVLAVFKKYGLDEKECFFSSTSNIIKFVKDMRKLMGIGD